MNKVYLVADGAKTVKEEVVNQVDMGYQFVVKLKHFFLDNIVNIISGIIICIIGMYMAQIVRAGIRRILTRANYDQTVISFVSQLLYYIVVFLAVITGLTVWGVPSTSFVAMIGGLGIAVGLALQSNMANFASGLLLLVFKPFRVGDWVQVSGSSEIVGSIDRIELLYTTIISKERRVIFVPNSRMTSNAVINSTYQPTRFIRFDVSIHYNNNHHKAIELLRGIFHDNPNIINHDDVEIGITSFGDNAVIISAFPEVSRDFVLDVFYWVMSEIKDRFDANGITIPYPQRDLYIHSVNLKDVMPPVAVTGKILEEDEAATGVPTEEYSSIDSQK